MDYEDSPSLHLQMQEQVSPRQLSQDGEQLSNSVFALTDLSTQQNFFHFLRMSSELTRWGLQTVMLYTCTHTTSGYNTLLLHYNIVGPHVRVQQDNVGGMFTVDCGETLVSNTSTPRPTEEKSGNVEEFIYDPSSLHLGKYFIRKLSGSLL